MKYAREKLPEDERSNEKGMIEECGVCGNGPTFGAAWREIRRDRTWVEERCRVCYKTQFGRLDTVSGSDMKTLMRGLAGFCSMLLDVLDPYQPCGSSRNDSL